ncbi:FAD-dependent oxidoreductase [Rhizobium sp. KVB221]|uniref:FAD-dependent oxidoreductase n=1 Tax=Rhizobium setariae TaxID=2801340 RepID=A0A936YTP7_9HYPH|nr:FAD-dependent oxidoreductase [Rhizobium setariae]MBL0372285.1 FAD-dependent oxidoreductase [Rhizobium setariae]
MSGQSHFDDAFRFPVWRQGLPEQTICPPLAQDTSADIAIVGGGFVGLWSALKARERWPDAQIVVIEAACCGEAASGRNGGFCAPSISHGVANAVARWPGEAETLVRLGRQNLDALEADLGTYGIDAEFQRSGKLNVAAKPWQVDSLRAMKELYGSFGIDAQLLAGRDLAERLDSPLYVAGLFEPNYALVHPGKLVSGLRAACLAAGVAIHENSRVTSISRRNDHIYLGTPDAILKAPKVALATNADIPLLRRLRPTILPVFDYSLVTEPLSDEQFRSIGWSGNYGVADCGNQFHYSRKTADNRILWGGFDAIYHRGGRRDPELLDRAKSFATLEANFSAAFPALAGVRFDHRWGGIIDTSARTTFFAGTAYAGHLAYALGFTGQGVSASRFAALAMLDLLEGKRTERTELRMLRSRPVPFPPEPFCDIAVRWTQRDLAREDETGRRSPMLRALDRIGVGFAS